MASRKRQRWKRLQSALADANRRYRLEHARANEACDERNRLLRDVALLRERNAILAEQCSELRARERGGRT